MARKWQHMTGAELQALDRDNTVVVVTSSPLEVHGPHLPTITDCLEAEGIAERAMEVLQTRHPEITFVTLPAIYVAADVLPHVGSLRFRSSTVSRVLTELGDTLAKQGFRHIWVQNFHGGPRHFIPIEVACDRVSRRHKITMISVFSLMMTRLTQGGSDLSDVFAHIDGIQREDLVGDSHGGAVETSMMLHLLGQHVDPGYRDLSRQTVHTARASQGKPALLPPGEGGLSALVATLKAKLLYYVDHTYSGHPARATPELGDRFLATLGELAADGLSDVWTGAITHEACHSPAWSRRWLFTVRPFGWLFERVVGYRTPL